MATVPSRDSGCAFAAREPWCDCTRLPARQTQERSPAEKLAPQLPDDAAAEWALAHDQESLHIAAGVTI